MLGNAVFIYVG